MINALETWRQVDQYNWKSNTWVPNNFSGPSIGFFQFMLNNMSPTTEIRIIVPGSRPVGDCVIKTIKNRIKRLSDTSLDLELLDQQARIILGMIGEDELIVF